MGYKKAEEILPAEIITLIQQYVDGQMIYIPRKVQNRKKWGTNTDTRRELTIRNQRIYADFLAGIPIPELALQYCLSAKSIQHIIRNMKMEHGAAAK